MKTINLQIINMCLEILDVRSPNLTRCIVSEKMLKSVYKSDFIMVLNKSDLVPKWIIKFWLKYYTRNNLVIAVSCKFNAPRGIKYVNKLLSIKLDKGNKIQTILVFGREGVGKSSFIYQLSGAIKSFDIKNQKSVNYIKIFKKSYAFEIRSENIIPRLKCKTFNDLKVSYKKYKKIVKLLYYATKTFYYLGKDLKKNKIYYTRERIKYCLLYFKKLIEINKNVLRRYLDKGSIPYFYIPHYYYNVFKTN